MMTLSDGRKSIWQYDTGVRLYVEQGIDQVHFSNKAYGRSVDVDVVDGFAIIPDFLLQTDKELTAWAYVGEGLEGQTKYCVNFKVNRRPKPADYVFTPTDQMTIDEIMHIAQSVRDDADNGVFDGQKGEKGDDGLTPYIGQNGNWWIGDQDTGVSASGGVGGGGDGKGVRIVEKISTVGKVDTYRMTFTDGTYFDYNVTNGTDGKNGTNGTNGIDGDDGYSPTIKISNITNGHRVSITDINSTKNFDVLNGENGKDGEKGEKGDDYVLTDADKQEIADLVEIPEGGGGSYKLPVASQYILGGVQPVTKANDMTQPVGVDGNGRLYTLASASAGYYTPLYTKSGETWICSATFSEIKNAYNSGKIIMAYTTKAYWLAMIEEEFFVFSRHEIDGNEITISNITHNYIGTITVVDDTIIHPTQEEWTFELEDGSTVTKKVALYE